MTELEEWKDAESNNTKSTDLKKINIYKIILYEILDSFRMTCLYNKALDNYIFGEYPCQIILDLMYSITSYIEHGQAKNDYYCISENITKYLNDATPIENEGKKFTLTHTDYSGYLYLSTVHYSRSGTKCIPYSLLMLLIEYQSTYLELLKPDFDILKNEGKVIEGDIKSHEEYYKYFGNKFFKTFFNGKIKNNTLVQGVYLYSPSAYTSDPDFYHKVVMYKKYSELVYNKRYPLIDAYGWVKEYNQVYIDETLCKQVDRCYIRY